MWRGEREKGKEKKNQQKKRSLTLEFLKVPLFVFLAEERSVWHPSLEGGPAVQTLGLALSTLLLSRWPNSRQGSPHPARAPAASRLQPARVRKASFLPLANNNNLKKKFKKAKKCGVYASKPSPALARSRGSRGAPARARLPLGWMGLSAGLRSDSFCTPSLCSHSLKV